MPRWARWGFPSSSGTVQLDNGTPGPARHLDRRPERQLVESPLAAVRRAPAKSPAPSRGRSTSSCRPFFPTPASRSANIDTSAHVTNLANPVSTTTVTVPNLAAARSGISLNGIMDQFVDGWDGLMRMLQSALTQQINAANIPVVGTAVAAGAGLPADDGSEGDVAPGNGPADRRHDRAGRHLRRPRAPGRSTGW